MFRDKKIYGFTFFSILAFIGCGSNSISLENNSLDITLPPPMEFNITRYKPTLNTTWQWQLSGAINTSYSVDLYDIDLFDTPKETIDKLHSMGKRVICYFSAGTFEDWRVDSSSFPTEVLGEELSNWEGERWLDIRDSRVKDIMKERLDLAKSKGCDGVEPDNIDAYSNNTGFNLSYMEQLDYNCFIANEAHRRGLSVGLKNDFDQAKLLEPYFDFSLSESCFEYSECNKLTPFIKAQKPVFNVEYNSKYITDKSAREELCSRSRELKFKTLILPLNLDDSYRYSCD